MGLVTAGAAVVGATTWNTVLAQSTVDAAPRWSDPATWGGRVPSAGEWVSLDRPVVLDIDAQVDGLAIQIGGALIFDPDRSCTLTSTANVVVLGLLQMRPSSAAVNHLIRFIGIDESKFVGGGHMVLDSDVGLWCANDGIVDVAGTPRRAWARTASSVAAGDTRISLQTEPVGWQVGDEIAIAPTLDTEQPDQYDAYDHATVTSISGSTVGLSAPTRFAHPVVDVGNGVVVAPEVLNLTRNVNIEGTPGGRAHIIFVHTNKPQRMSYFGARWVAPRQATGERDFTEGVLGRYGLHFHMLGDASRGSKLVGAVVRDAGGHAFVAHASHGVSFTSCISHDTFDDAFWWDTGPASDEVTYESCVASRVKCDPGFRGYRLAGFVLGSGTGNRVRDSIAVGVRGNVHAAGFRWREGSSGIWEFERNISHNNRANGIFTWQNNSEAHVVEDFVSFHNGAAGIKHGAYLNSYLYRNGYVFQNGGPALEIHSNSHSERPQRFVGLHCVASPNSEYAVRIMKHTLPPGRPSQFLACTFIGQSRAAIGVVHDPNTGATTPELFDVVHCQSTSPLLWLREDTQAGSLIRVQTPETSLAVTPLGTAGTYRPEWNAMTATIAPFSTDSIENRAGSLEVVAGARFEETSPATGASPPTTPTIPLATTIPSQPTTTLPVAPSTIAESTEVIQGRAKAKGRAKRNMEEPKPGRKK